MNWCDERYVRLYVRDTTDWLCLGWEAQSLFMLILRKVDRTGVLEGKPGEERWARALSSWFRMPLEVTTPALRMLLEDGCIQMVDQGLLVKNYLEAQEASMSPNLRQQESRLRRRDMLRSGLDPDQRGTVVYFLQSEHGGEVKIGRAEDLAKRLQQLNTGRPDHLVVLAAATGAIADEAMVHRLLEQHRVKGEWFSDCAEVREVIGLVSSKQSDAWKELRSRSPRDQSQPVTGHSVPSVPCLPSVSLSPPSAPVFDFEALYRPYPCKEGKRLGMKTLERTVKTQAQYDSFAAALRGYLERERAKGTQAKFHKHWSTFVNQWAGIAEELADAKGAPSQQPSLQSIPSNWAEVFTLAKREQAILAEGKTPPWWSLPRRWNMTTDLSGDQLIPVRDGRAVTDAA